MTVLIMPSIHRILLDQPQALYCPNGPLGSMPKLTVLAPPTSHPQCDMGTLRSVCHPVHPSVHTQTFLWQRIRSDARWPQLTPATAPCT